MILAFLADDTQNAFTLCGYAGTGKTTLINNILKEHSVMYEDNRLVAPTHKACRIISEACEGREAITLHSLMGYSPLVQIENFDPDNPEFGFTNTDKFPRKGNLFDDEASMTGEKFMFRILEYCVKYGSKVLFIGDPCQLPPINEKISKIFSLPSITLTEVVRTDIDNLLEAATYLRNNIHNKHPRLAPFIDNKALCLYDDTKVKNSLENLFDNRFNAKYLTFKKDTAYAANRIIRKIISPEASKYRFVPGDIINPFVSGVQSGSGNYMNSEDLMVVNCSFRTFDIAGYGIETDYLECINEDDEKVMVKVVRPESYYAFYHVYNYLKTEAKNEKDYNSRARKNLEVMKIRCGFLVMDRIVSPKASYYNYEPTVDYGFAMTVHRSQGASYPYTYIDSNDLATCKDIWTRNRLLYVGITRAVSKCILVK